nr:hypothetical protein CFP56_66852 [Quercus suber]
MPALTSYSVRLDTWSRRVLKSMVDSWTNAVGTVSRDYKLVEHSTASSRPARKHDCVLGRWSLLLDDGIGQLPHQVDFGLVAEERRNEPHQSYGRRRLWLLRPRPGRMGDKME